MSEFIAATQSELQSFVADNARGERHALYPAGGRTKMHLGYPPRVEGTNVSMSRVARLVDYPARDMTVTVEAGMKVAELDKLLLAERQRLPVDVPHADRATVGGAVATNVSGPRRFGYGTFRDYVIGITAIDAQGRLFHGGGRVVKNVAGYDLCKLLVGSYGTLALITQLTFKVRPAPESSRLVWMTFEKLGAIDAVLEHLTTSGTRPVCLEVLNPAAAARIARDVSAPLPFDRPVLCVGFEGGVQEVEWQVSQLHTELASHSVQERTVLVDETAQPLWRALTEFQGLTNAPLTFHAGLRPSKTMEFVRMAGKTGMAVQAHSGNGIVIAHLPENVQSVEQAEKLMNPLRTFALDLGGSLTLLHCDPSWKDRIPVFSRRADSLELMRNLKRMLDPQNLLNPFRYFDGGLA